MDGDFMKLHSMLMQKFAVFQSEVEIFQRGSKKLLNTYLDDLHDDNLNPKHTDAFMEYKDYLDVLFVMLTKTTEYIGDMMSNSVITKNLLRDELTYSLLTLSDDTMTGLENGFTEMNFSAPSKENLSENEVFSTKSNILTEAKFDLPCGVTDISVFTPGTVIQKASVSSLKLEDLSFHICVLNNQKFPLLAKLYNAKDRKVFKYAPPPGLIFGMRVEEGIVRAIRFDPFSNNKVLLLDFGDIVDLTEDLNEIYHLTIEEQKIPASAIPCKLYTGEVSDSNNEELKAYLNSILYKEASFYVVDVSNGVLYLKEQASTAENKTLQKNNFDIESTTLWVDTQSEPQVGEQYNKLSVGEWEILNEEPLNTSNALKAVMGYVPKDDQRICRFYDPEIGTCFKGNTCRQEHTMLLKDYYTKDIVPTNVYRENPNTCILYSADEILQITVTHVKSVEYFYGIVNNSKAHTEPFIWKDSDIPQSSYMKKAPYEYDIVLAKYDDGCWYRAQIVDVDESQKFFKVFYIDYGNEQRVPLAHLARCDEANAKLPAQAIQFRLANVQAIPEEKDALKHGLRMLCDMIVNRDLNILVVSHYEDLVVRFIDEPFSDIPQLLSGMQCVKLIEMF